MRMTTLTSPSLPKELCSFTTFPLHTPYHPLVVPESIATRRRHRTQSEGESVDGDSIAEDDAAAVAAAAKPFGLAAFVNALTKKGSSNESTPLPSPSRSARSVSVTAAISTSVSGRKRSYGHLGSRSERSSRHQRSGSLRSKEVPALMPYYSTPQLDSEGGIMKVLQSLRTVGEQKRRDDKEGAEQKNHDVQGGTNAQRKISFKSRHTTLGSSDLSPAENATVEAAKDEAVARPTFSIADSESGSDDDEEDGSKLVAPSFVQQRRPSAYVSGGRKASTDTNTVTIINTFINQSMTVEGDIIRQQLSCPEDVGDGDGSSSASSGASCFPIPIPVPSTAGLAAPQLRLQPPTPVPDSASESGGAETENGRSPHFPRPTPPTPSDHTLIPLSHASCSSVGDVDSHHHTDADAADRLSSSLPVGASQSSCPRPPPSESAERSPAAAATTRALLVSNSSEVVSRSASSANSSVIDLKSPNAAVNDAILSRQHSAASCRFEGRCSSVPPESFCRPNSVSDQAPSPSLPSSRTPIFGSRSRHHSLFGQAQTLRSAAEPHSTTRHRSLISLVKKTLGAGGGDWSSRDPPGGRGSLLHMVTHKKLTLSSDCFHRSTESAEHHDGTGMGDEASANVTASAAPGGQPQQRSALSSGSQQSVDHLRRGSPDCDSGEGI